MSDWNEDDHPRDDDGRFGSGGGGDDGDAGSDDGGESSGDEESSRPASHERLATARERHSAAEARHSEAKAAADASRAELERLTTDAETEVREIKEEAAALLAGHKQWKADTKATEKAAVREVREAVKAADIGYDEEDVIDSVGQRAYNLRDAETYTRAAEANRSRGDLDGAKEASDRAERARELAQGELDANPEIYALPAPALAAAERADTARTRLEETDTGQLRDQVRLANKAEQRLAELRQAASSGGDIERAVERANEAYHADISGVEAENYREAAGLPPSPAKEISGGLHQFDASEHAKLTSREARAERALRTHEREVKRLEKAIDRDGDGRVNEEERGTTEAERAETTPIPMAQAKREIWKIEARAAKQEIEIDIYEDIGGIALLGGGFSAKTVRDALRGAGSKDVLCRIHSAGGIVTEGLAIYNLLKQHQGKVTCRVDSLAGSIASIIAMAGDELEMAEHSWLMIHNPFGMIEGGAEELRRQAALLDGMHEQMVDIYSAKSGRTREDCSALMLTDTWMTARDALGFGFCNRIIADNSSKLVAKINLAHLRDAPRSLVADVGHRADPVIAASVAEALRQLAENSVLVTTNANAQLHIGARGGVVTTNSTDAGKLALETEETTMAMTDEETKKFADLEAENAALKASLSTEQGARASAEEALAAAKKPKAEDDDEEDEDEEDEEKVAAKAAIEKAKELTGCTDVKLLRGALIGLEFKIKQGGQSAETHQAKVKRLVAEGKLAPYLKATALKEWSPADLDGFLAMTKGAKMGPVGEELEPDESATEVVQARAGVAPKAREFDPTKVALEPEEVRMCQVRDPFGTDGFKARYLADKVARAKVEFEARA